MWHWATNLPVIMIDTPLGSTCSLYCHVLTCVLTVGALLDRLHLRNRRKSVKEWENLEQLHQEALHLWKSHQRDPSEDRCVPFSPSSLPISFSSFHLWPRRCTVTSFFTYFRPLFPIFLTFCLLPLFACLRSLSSYFLLYFFPSFCLPFKSLLSSSFLQSSFLPSFPSFIPSSTLFLYSFPLCSLPFIPAIPSYPT